MGNKKGKERKEKENGIDIFRFLILIFIGIVLFFLLSSFSFEKLSSLKGKKVIVCGASTGIGEEIAYRYSREGAEVVIIARREKELERVARECKRLGALDVHIVVADLSTELGCDLALSKSLKHLNNKLDTLILNHIVGYFGKWLEKDPKERYQFLEKMFRINTFSYFHLAVEALPFLNLTGGKIAVVSSVAGRMGTPMTVPYSSSKHALHGFFDSLRQDLYGTTNVTITMHTIGSIDTPNAVAATQGYLENLYRYPADEAADSIVTTTELRHRESYFPYMESRFSVLVNQFFPDFMDWLVRWMVL